jgi:toxin FitB
MIILDTNVVAEPMRIRGSDAAVTAWFGRQLDETLYLTTTSLAELLLGAEILPGGSRKEGLGRRMADYLERLFGPRILPFDHPAALAYAALVGRARAAGRAVSFADGQIAAIAAVHGFSVATRDTAPFAATGIPVINPWTVRAV